MRGLFFAWLLVSATAHSDTLDWPAQPPQQGQFEQHKHIKVLAQPFVSQGLYSYNRQSGIVWRTQQPIENTLIINAQGVFETQQDGSKTLLTANTRMSELLLVLFSGDEQLLQMHFDLKKTVNHYLLQPIDAKLRKLFAKITITFDNNLISQISLYEPNGNYTDIFLGERAATEPKVNAP